jgi:hypothetical protein
LCRQTNRFQSGTADLVDRHRRDIGQQSSPKRSLAGGVLSEACRYDVTHDGFIHLLCGNTRALILKIP